MVIYCIISVFIILIFAIVIYKIHTLNKFYKEQSTLIQEEIEYISKFILFQTNAHEFELWGLRNEFVDKMNKLAKEEKYEQAASYKEAAIGIQETLKYCRENLTKPQKKG